MKNQKTEKDDTLRLRLPASLKEDYLLLCELKGTNASVNLREHVAAQVRANKKLITEAKLSSNGDG